jgi:hypothetical protein
MKMLRPLAHWCCLPALSIVLLGAFCPQGSAQSTQPGAATAAADKSLPPATFTNKTSFKLPIRMDEQSRAQVKQVVLYVRENGREWKLAQTVSGTASHFFIKAAHDGEYWFSVVTVDRNGKASPEDIRKVPPALILVVDTQPPAVQVTPVNLPGGAMALRCQIRDANPDYQRLQMAYRGVNSQAWLPLDRVPNTVDQFRLPDAPVLNGSVRYIATDSAGNTTTKVMALQEQTPVQAASPIKQVAQEIKQTEAPGLPTPPEVTRAAFPAGPNGLPPLEKAEPVIPPAPPIVKTEPTAPPVPQRDAGFSGGHPPSTSNYNSGANLPTLPQAASTGPMPQPSSSLEASAAGTSLSPRQVINTTRASIDYKIDKVGSSGVGKVDVWIKADQGGAWQRLCSDEDRRSPVEINLPGEGLFGIQVVVTNGNGFGGKPPAPNDPPAFWLEVDSTRPFAQLHPVDPVIAGGSIDIRWTASDKNLGATPVSLSYAVNRSGPWLPVAQRIKNTGHYTWQFPHDSGCQFYIRLDVTDVAGNTTRCETSRPVVLDLTEPRAQVVGVTSVGAVSPQPQGN